MPNQASQFVWHELMTTALEPATAFYKTVIGWTAQDAGMGGKPYMLLSAGAAMVGGVMETPEEVRAMGIPPCWTGYIGVASVDAAVTKLLAGGGRVQRPADDIPGIGRFAVVTDPQGAVFILFTPAGDQAPLAAAPGTPGLVGWNELWAVDGPAAFDFYAAQFGWTKGDAIDMGDMGIYQLFAAGGMPIGGMMTKPPAVPMPCWGYYFNVPDIKAAIGRVTAEGGKVIHGPTPVPGGMFVAQCVDPQGAMFGMVAPV